MPNDREMLRDERAAMAEPGAIERAIASDPTGDVPDPIWNIMCPGPSLFGVDLGAEREHPTVAINAAIGHRDGADYWCVQDHPKIAWHDDYRERVLGMAPELWVSTVHLELWKAWAPDLTVYGNPLNMHTVLRSPKWFVDLWFMPARSVFAAILRSIWAGAKDIRVYGCDMTGETTHRGESGEVLPSQTDPAWWKERWETEKSCLARMVKVCKDNGVTISFVKMPEVVT